MTRTYTVAVLVGSLRKGSFTRRLAEAMIKLSPTNLRFATPEYNRLAPGVLKNALDVGSRPFGKSVWNAKPAAVISASPGTMGGFGANHHLRQSLVYLNMPVLHQPEAYTRLHND